jgi:hypothetical protein
MPPTTFETTAIFPPGPGRRSQEIVAAKPWPQRVVGLNVSGGGIIRVSDAPNAGTGPRNVVIPATGPTVIVLAPGQSLYGVSDSAAGRNLALSVSATIPGGRSRQMGASIFTTVEAGVAGSTGAQLLDASDLPRRVVLSLPTLIFGQVATAPSSLKNAVAAANANAFTVIGAIFMTFVLAPGQALFGSLGTGSGAGGFSVHASDLVGNLPRGPTGIPGPDGQE